MKYGLVTGVSTGIGNGIASALIKAGWHVFGSVRKQKDAEECVGQFGEGFTPLLFDVTDRDAIESAKEEVERILGDQSLAGLVNNAGYAVGGPLQEVPVENVRQQFEVNVIGALNVTQTFLPMLGAQKEFKGTPGKIINISSIAGRIAFPFMGPYAASKHALEALSDSLRRELQIFGIDVVVIEPGAIKTPIWGKGRDREIPKESPYFESLSRFAEITGGMFHKARPVEDVAEVVLDAFTSANPKTRYVISESWLTGWFIPRHLPDRMLDRGVARHLGLRRRN